jgi:hypothetical protein
MVGPTRVTTPPRGLTRAITALAATLAIVCTAPSLAGPVIRVPEDAGSIQAAVASAASGSLILIAPGTYDEAVLITTPGLTLSAMTPGTVQITGAADVDGDGAVAFGDLVAVLAAWGGC